MAEGGGRSEATAVNSSPRWDLSGMGSAYCNIASAMATRDSIVINLGLSQPAGDRARAELKAELLHRILLSPRTAEHLHRILGALLGEYETQHGGGRR